MLPVQRIKAALHFQELDRPPHFEQIFELTEEAFGVAMPSEEEIAYAHGRERNLLFEKCANLYAMTIKRFSWDAVLIWRPAMVKPADVADHHSYMFIPYLKEYLKKYFGFDIPVGAFVWQRFISLDVVKDYMDFSIKLFEEPEIIDNWAIELCQAALLHTQRLLDAGVDFINVNSDHALNNITFLRPNQFKRFVYPYVKALIEYIHSRGAWVIMHSDGNLMGILDQIVDINPDFLQSIDPMAGMDIREVKKLTYGKIGLMGNVECRLLQNGPDEAILGSAAYCLDHAAPSGGFIFSSSNTVYKGIPLRNYQLMLDFFHTRYR